MKYEEHFKYLDELRDSGVVNMICSAPFLADRFMLAEEAAVKILAAWIKRNINNVHNT